jgi:hypothetical protein
VTELNRGGGAETETTLEINGRIVPKNRNTKEFLKAELQKLNETGAELKQNLEGLKNIASRTDQQTSKRLQDLQKTAHQDQTINIKVVEEEEKLSESKNNGDPKTLTDLECTIHDLHPSDNKPSVTTVEVRNSRLLDPEEEPELETYIHKLQQIEQRLEGIADDFKNMMKNSDDQDKDKTVPKTDAQ